MSNILFFNVGSNDVKLNGERIPNPRDEGKRIFDNYKKEISNLSFEIIEPFLKEFQDVERIYLFVTNQEDKSYREGDTLYFGRIISKWVEDEFGYDVRVKEYLGNPTDLVNVYDFYKNFLADFLSFWRVTNNELLCFDFSFFYF